ncbi:condensin complex component cnd2 [Rhizoctonia solani AG-1 IA]|uniref:Condensin complex subunit 2 n=1 Tax=Thanatephorus cucumeris (strain AG1-IA) TaxID=983506 RepID=L8X098_THACA|nr:condensin complex component cnd2 [Rhizoctonia solani AG-1 IA]
MPARKRASSDTEIEDDDYDNGAEESSSRPKEIAKNKRRVSMLKETEGHSRSKSNFTMKSMDSTDLMANDDRSEKRRRRQSRTAAALIAEEGDGGSSSGVNGPRTPKKTAVARANMLNAVDHTPLPAVSLDVMTSNFEEWMKMATDNDGSVNFQKASYTLDGCVKVWTSRVDSCRNDTGKLLSNLTNDGGGGEEDDEGAEEGEGDGEEGSRNQAKRKRAHRPENTLAKSIEQLQVKKLDTECVVDPLFKKTSADFDEGGAGGMLMNHLNCWMKKKPKSRMERCPWPICGVSELVLNGVCRRSYFVAKYMPDLEELEGRSIMPSLSDFKFASDDLTFASHVLPSRNTPDEPMAFGERDLDMADTGDAGPVEDFFTGGEAVNDFEGGFHDSGGFDDDGGDDGVGDMGDYTGNPAGASHTGPVEPFDPRRGRDERTLIMSMSEDATEMLDYFDTTVMKNWAGPQHWKVRRAIRKDGDTTGNTTTRSRKDKTVFMIDFETPPAENFAKKWFVPATKAVLTLPSAKVAKKGSKGAKSIKKNEFLLPNDMHFSNEVCSPITDFIIPLKVQMRRINVDEPIKGEIGDALVSQRDGEIGGEFWAQAAADNAGAGPDDMDGGFPAPFATQFFHDEDDDGGFDDGDGDGRMGDMPAVDEEDLIAATQGTLKRVRPEHINYTKRAKRVDVRMLKENIWKGLNIVVPKSNMEDGHEEEINATTDEAEPTDPTEARDFTNVISNLRTQYPKDKLDEISTSFCFICLLHLANERGLKIQVGDAAPDWAAGKNMVVDDDAEAGADEADLKRIGQLSELHVFRDPDARPAA